VKEDDFDPDEDSADGHDDARNQETDPAWDDRDGDADATLVTEADVTCPWCGETVTIQLDPGGGSVQAYEEDCQICCRPWSVEVRFDRTGSPDVVVERAS